MNIRIASNFAVKNIRANKIFIIPFILSSSLMISLLYIMFSLMQNEFVKTRHTSLPMLINFGCIIVSIFTYIFIIYANRLLVKRRNREFALYGILGLEKKTYKKNNKHRAIYQFRVYIDDKYIRRSFDRKVDVYVS